MNISDFLVTLSQASQAEQTGLFPFPFSMHLIFTIISFIFFTARFVSEKHPYQLIMDIAVPFSLVLWIDQTNKIIFYTVGAVELVLIVSAMVTSIIESKKNKDKQAENGGEDKGESVREETAE